MTWFALITNPRCERRAEAGLRASGLATFLPQGAIWSKPRHAPEIVGRPRPAMPRYLFVSFYGETRWGVVRKTDGVAGVVSAAGRPLEIATPVLERIFDRQFVGALNFNERPRRKRGWKPGVYQRGMRLQITDGPLAGFIGTVIRPSGKQDVDLYVEMFGREAATVVKLEDVRVAA